MEDDYGDTSIKIYIKLDFTPGQFQTVRFIGSVSFLFIASALAKAWVMLKIIFTKIGWSFFYLFIYYPN